MQLKRFTYPLAGAQRLENYRLDGLTMELAQLKERLQAKVDEYERLDKSIEEAQRALIALIQQQPMFWMERREATLLQIADRRERRGVLNEEMEILRQDMTALIADITEARKSQKMYEKHSEHCRTAFDKQQEKAWEGWMDEIWLTREKGKS
jgi:chromosome segregation ATPase